MFFGLLRDKGFCIWESTGLAAGICSQNLWEVVVGFTKFWLLLFSTGYGNEFNEGVFLLGWFSQFGALTGTNGCWALFVACCTELIRTAGTILLLLLLLLVIILWCWLLVDTELIRAAGTILLLLLLLLLILWCWLLVATELIRAAGTILLLVIWCRFCCSNFGTYLVEISGTEGEK